MPAPNENELQLYQDAYGLELSRLEAELIARRLTRHFWKQRGGLSEISRKIPRQMNAGLLIHLFCHPFEERHRASIPDYIRSATPSRYYHLGEFKDIVGYVHSYARRKGYWQNEIKKQRANVREKQRHDEREKPAHCIDIITRKIKDAETTMAKKGEDIQRYGKRLKYFEHLYLNKIRKTERSLVGLKRAVRKYGEQMERLERLKNPVLSLDVNES